jgi:regulator of nonsense transcripts 2
MIILIATTKFGDMENLAILIAALKQQQRGFVVAILDHVFEQVVRGMEENDFKDAQRRISLMKFLGCLYNYKVIHTDTLLCLLYKLINLDLPATVDERLQAYDPPQDCFRIRLVCTLLDSLGRTYFLKHKRRLLMDRFLIFFQRYIYSKSYILMDLEFMLLDTFEAIRPKQAPKVNSLEEAKEACQRIIEAESD